MSITKPPDINPVKLNIDIDRPETLRTCINVDKWAHEAGVSPARIKNGLAQLRLRGLLKRVPSAADLESGELGAPGNVLAFRPRQG
ncbi:hypothetical protein [Pseudomonas sp. PSPC3-3]|uniref:hypothetical protein n=1 Tax=unclassified Pseudomonas TaxID=196821 RepID=UPI003CEB9418